jgi:hypothetical protein
MFRHAAVILPAYSKDRFLQRVHRALAAIRFSCRYGAALLLDFRGAQASSARVQLNFLKLVASYLEAADQLILGAGREVTP